jgi:hypothetical protein
VLLAAAILTLASSSIAADAATAPPISAERRAQETAFMRSVKPNQTANAMTGNVLAHVGERVAYMCRIEEVTRPPVVVGQCGAESEPVDLYLKLPPGHWRLGDKVRVLGILDTPASWSDIGGHTVYYPFVKAVFADRIR